MFGAGGDQCGGQGVAQVEDGDAAAGLVVAVVEPGPVQGGHGGAAQFGLGDVEGQFGADVHEAAALAAQEVVGVEAGVGERGLLGAAGLPLLAGGGDRGDRGGGVGGQDAEVGAELVAGDEVGVVQGVAEDGVGVGGEVGGGLSRLQVGAGVLEGQVAQVGARAAVGDVEPDDGDAERLVAVLDPVVLGPLHVDAGDADGSGGCGGAGGPGAVVDHGGLQEGPGAAPGGAAPGDGSGVTVPQVAGAARALGRSCHASAASAVWRVKSPSQWRFLSARPPMSRVARAVPSAAATASRR
ncbi:hypothetical protein ACFQZC_38505 [Streptacidiphilus monticola]